MRSSLPRDGRRRRLGATRVLDRRLAFRFSKLVSQHQGGHQEQAHVADLADRASGATGARLTAAVGDAVAARNTHAAIYDALRLVKDL